MTESEGVEAARAAVEQGAWNRALRLLDEAGADGSTPEGLELRAQASYGDGDFEGAISAWENLYGLLATAGDAVGAARAAAMLAMFLLIDTGLMAPVRGWVRRAEAQLAGHTETPPHALISMVRTYERFMCGDLEAARAESAIALDLGVRLGVTPAMVIGRVVTARLALLDGHMTEGLGQLDEVATLLMSGDVDPLTTGMMYCELICAAQGLALHDRALEWTDVMERWRHGNAFGAINGRCRVHRAELLRMSGPCDKAEHEALRACEELRPWMRREFGWPLVELGNIRLRMGDLVGAEEAFLAAHERAWSAQPGLALLRLAQGEVATAASMIAEEVAHPADLPWKERPPTGELRMAPLLDAQAEIAVAAGDLPTARLAADALARIADHFPSPSLRAGALRAEARVRLASGDLASAKAAATGAMVLWSDLGAPFDAAVARTLLAEVRRLEQHHEASQLEWRSARDAFATFGAQRWVATCDIALGASQHSTEDDPEPRRLAGVFHLDGEVRRIELAGQSASLRDMKGFRYLARLLAEPGREFHALDLVAAEERNGAASSDRAEELDDDPRLAAAGLPVLDDRARAAYRRRLEEVEDDIDEAVRSNDPARRELAERDRDYLVAELRSAIGLGGRERTTGGNAERARTAVTRSLRYALARLEEQAPLAAGHLEQHIRTGTYCSYAPDPVAPIAWEL